MKNEEPVESALEKLLKKLNESALKIVETSGYSSESEKIRAIEELIKEQLGHENTRYSTRQVR